MKKRSHNHNHNQTNPKPQPKTKTQPKTQQEETGCAQKNPQPQLKTKKKHRRINTQPKNIAKPIKKSYDFISITQFIFKQVISTNFSS
jgi:hypothetical protein